MVSHWAGTQGKNGMQFLTWLITNKFLTIPLHCVLTSKTIRGCLLVGELEALVTSWTLHNWSVRRSVCRNSMILKNFDAHFPFKFFSKHFDYDSKNICSFKKNYCIWFFFSLEYSAFVALVHFLSHGYWSTWHQVM